MFLDVRLSVDLCNYFVIKYKEVPHPYYQAMPSLECVAVDQIIL